MDLTLLADLGNIPPSLEGLMAQRLAVPLVWAFIVSPSPFHSTNMANGSLNRGTGRGWGGGWECVRPRGRGWQVPKLGGFAPVHNNLAVIS